MTDQSARLLLPLLHPGQAQKEIFHNEALLMLDMLTCCSAVEIALDTPPDDPGPGQCWVLGSAPEGVWSGHAGAIAGWTEGGWRFLEPRQGMRVWAGETQGFALFTDGEWRVGTTYGKLFIEGEQVVGPRLAAVAEPAGGGTVDAEARAAIVAVLEALRVHGLIGSD